MNYRYAGWRTNRTNELVAGQTEYPLSPFHSKSKRREREFYVGRANVPSVVRFKAASAFRCWSYRFRVSSFWNSTSIRCVTSFGLYFVHPCSCFAILLPRPAEPTILGAMHPAVSLIAHSSDWDQRKSYIRRGTRYSAICTDPQTDKMDPFFWPERNKHWTQYG